MNKEEVLKEEAIINQWKLWRNWVVDLIDIIPEEHYDEIPSPYRNNIRWNAGHLLTGFDDQVAVTLGVERRLPEKYHIMFPRESSPADWTEEPPSMDEIKEKLQKQPDELAEVVRGKLDTPLKEEFLGIKTLGEMMQFLTSHDALHLSTMNSIRRLLKSS